MESAGNGPSGWTLILRGLQQGQRTMAVVPGTLCGARDTTEAGLRPADSREPALSEVERAAVPTKLYGGDAADQIFLLRFTFSADGKGIQDAERERVLNGFILTTG
jgi:hypothetical protein